MNLPRPAAHHTRGEPGPGVLLLQRDGHAFEQCERAGGRARVAARAYDQTRPELAEQARQAARAAAPWTAINFQFCHTRLRRSGSKGSSVCGSFSRGQHARFHAAQRTHEVHVRTGTLVHGAHWPAQAPDTGDRPCHRRQTGRGSFGPAFRAARDVEQDRRRRPGRPADWSGRTT